MCVQNWCFFIDQHYLPLQPVKALLSLLTFGMLRPQNKQLEQLQLALPKLHSSADLPWKDSGRKGVKPQGKAFTSQGISIFSDQYLFCWYHHQTEYCHGCQCSSSPWKIRSIFWSRVQACSCERGKQIPPRPEESHGICGREHHRYICDSRKYVVCIVVSLFVFNVH